MPQSTQILDDWYIKSDLKREHSFQETAPESFHAMAQSHNQTAHTDNQKDTIFLLANILWKFRGFAQGTSERRAAVQVSSAQLQPKCQRLPGRAATSLEKWLS